MRETTNVSSDLKNFLRRVFYDEVKRLIESVSKMIPVGSASVGWELSYSTSSAVFAASNNS